MSVVTDLRKTVVEATPVLAVVGATDLAVERVRKAAAEAGHRRGELTTEFETRVTKVQIEVEKAVAALDPDYLQKFIAKTFDPKNLQAGAQQVPALAVSRALEVAGRVETGYEHLAERGKKLLARGEAPKATTKAPTKTVTKPVKASTVAETVAASSPARAKRTTTTPRKRTAPSRSSAKGSAGKSGS